MLPTLRADEWHVLVDEAQREVRTVFIGGFWGQMVSAAVWLASAALAVWSTPRAAIIAVVAGGFFIFPLTQLALWISGNRASLRRENPLGALGMQVAFIVPISMLLLAPVTAYRLNWFYPALMILVGAHYLPFVFLYGMRMFMFLATVLVGGGVLTALYVPHSFSIGGWIGGAALLIFAWIGRGLVRTEESGKRRSGRATNA
jgi:hypothetical protein